MAIPKRELLTIDASNSSQQCEKFGLHPKLPYLQSLYNDNNALFFAGIGVLNNPVTKLDFMHKTRTQLFAHNTSKYNDFQYVAYWTSKALVLAICPY